MFTFKKTKLPNFKKMTEEELREYKIPWPKTIKELNRLLKALEKANNDYGKAVYVMSIGSLACFYYLSHIVGASGAQASFADMDFLKRSRGMEGGFRILDYSNLLYPQYLNSDNFPTIEKLLSDNKEYLSKKAKKLLKESPNAATAVVAHWKGLL